MDEFDNLLWAYRAVFKQTDAGGGTVLIRIKANERTVILFGQIGPNDYAAGRTVNVAFNDGTNNIGILHKTFTLDNQTLPFPKTGEGIAVTANSPTEFGRYVIMAKDDEVRILTSALVQNEEVTVAIRALIRSWPPTISTTGSGGTVTTTVDYDKVV